MLTRRERSHHPGRPPAKPRRAVAPILATGGADDELGRPRNQADQAVGEDLASKP